MSSRKFSLAAKIAAIWSRTSRAVALLLEHLGHVGAVVELLLRGGVQVGAELGEGLHLSV